MVDSLPELDRGTLLRGIRKTKSPGKLPSKYVANSERVENKEQVQHEFDYAGDVVDLTWDDHESSTALYGRDQSGAASEESKHIKSIEDWSYDEDDDLVVKALSYYSDQLEDTRHLSEMIADTCNEIPMSVVKGISDEELELNYREFEIIMQGLEAQAEHTDMQDTAPSIGGQGVA